MHVHHFAAIVAVPFCTGIWTLLAVGLLEGFSLGLSNAGAFNKYSLNYFTWIDLTVCVKLSLT